METDSFSTSELAATAGRGAGRTGRQRRRREHRLAHDPPPGSSTCRSSPARDGHAYVPAWRWRPARRRYLTAREPGLGGTGHRASVTPPLRCCASAGWPARRVGGAIGVTGSVGKTTTKDLLAGCLASTFGDRRERALLQQRARPAADAAGRARRRAGRCSRWALGVSGTSRGWRPSRAPASASMSVAKAHVEHFGDLDGVARAKGELIAALPAAGSRS